MTQYESAVIVSVPAAEPLVGDWRKRYDSSAARGVPAHITLLYPFRAPDALDDGVIMELADIFAAVAPFEFALNRVARFDTVLWLAPEPAAPFSRLIDALAARFPDTPPYGGIHAEVIPHLTVADATAGDALESVTRDFAEVASGVLPIETAATEAWLIVEQADGWHLRKRFALGPRHDDTDE